MTDILDDNTQTRLKLITIKYFVNIQCDFFKDVFISFFGRKNALFEI